ncbi:MULTISPECIES: sulfite exporter TauE/SafE family protein [Bacillus]|uniref:sulfite exporter TauE/SafE family protein n=1 Tax=Bacillus TaxID=1386 RepID=UPI0012FE9847|nr:MULTISPECIES: sulfite exporter TauE/SafE family protein [Bacillus]
MEQYLFITLIGFVATFIGTLGGGGGLISLPAMLFLGVPIHSAIAANKFSNTFSSFSSFFALWRKKEVNAKLAFSLLPFTMAGGVIGAIGASILEEHTLLYIALFLLIFSIFLNNAKDMFRFISRKQKKLFSPTYFMIGAYDGFFGPGQAIMLMHSFLSSGYSYVTSIGLSRLQTFASCIMSFLVYFSFGYFDWRVGGALAIGSFIGALTAVLVAPKLSNLPWKHILTFCSICIVVYLIFKL